MTPHEAKRKIREAKLQIRHTRSRGATGMTHRIELGYADMTGAFLAFAAGVGDTKNEALASAVELFEARGVAYIMAHPNWQAELTEFAIEEGITPPTIPFI